ASIQPALLQTAADAFLTPQQKQTLQAAVAKAQIPLNLQAALGKTGLTLPRTLNAGAALSADGSFVVVRLQYTSPVEQEWTDFYAGATPGVLGPSQWAMALPAQLLVQLAQTLLAPAAAGSSAFTVTQAPFTGWEPIGGIPLLHVTMAGTAIN